MALSLQLRQQATENALSTARADVYQIQGIRATVTLVVAFQFVLNTKTSKECLGHGTYGLLIV